MTEAELAGQIEPLLSETMQVKTAAAQASEDSADTQEGLNVIKYFLLGFGGIALFVGSFVIANTLAITVAQRMRELATLRTLGASRRQVLGSVILESLAIGLVGSIIGLFLGLGIAVGLMSAARVARHRPAERRTGLLGADDHRQPRHRHPDRSAGEPPACDAGDADRADRRSPGGLGHAALALRALRSAGLGGRRRHRDRAASPTVSSRAVSTSSCA